MNLFKEKRINDTYNGLIENMVTRVNGLQESRILNGNVEKLTNDLFKSLKINPLIIDFSDRKVALEMTDRPGSHFPSDFDVSRERNYSCAEVFYTFTVISGDMELLTVQPNTHEFTKDVKVSMSGNNFTISYQTLYGNSELSEELKREIKSIMTATINEMESTVTGINHDLEEYNAKISDMIKEKIEQRKIKIKNKNSQNNELNDF